MGATPWGHFVDYQESVHTALENLRHELNDRKAWSIEAAMEDMEEAGSMPMLLNVMTISASPGMCCICPLPAEKLRELFGTEQPTREMIESNHDFFDEIERGEGIFITAYKDGKPSEYFFAGYSFD